jgi:hypothetical protein
MRIHRGYRGSHGELGIDGVSPLGHHGPAVFDGRRMRRANDPTSVPRAVQIHCNP